jgi:hypothetical protein
MIDNRGTPMLNKNEFTKKVRTVFFAKMYQLNNVDKEKSQHILDSLDCVPQMDEKGSTFVYNLGFTQVFSMTEYYLHLLDNFGPLGECYFTEKEIDAILEKHFDTIKLKRFLSAPTCSALFMFNCGLRYGNTVDLRRKITQEINTQFADKEDSSQNLETSIFALFQPAAEVVDIAVPQVIISDMKL